MNKEFGAKLLMVKVASALAKGSAGAVRKFMGKPSPLSQEAQNRIKARVKKSVRRGQDTKQLPSLDEVLSGMK